MEGVREADLQLHPPGQAGGQKLCGQLARARQMLEDSKEDGTWKMISKLWFLISLGTTPVCMGEFFIPQSSAGDDIMTAFSSSMDTRSSQKRGCKGGDVRQCEAQPPHHGCHAILLKFLMQHSVKLLLAKLFPSLQLVVQLLLLEPGSED